MLTFSRLLLVSAALFLSSSSSFCVEGVSSKPSHHVSKLYHKYQSAALSSVVDTEVKLAGLVERLIELEDRIEQREEQLSEQTTFSPIVEESVAVQIDSVDDADTTDDPIHIAFQQYQKDFNKHYYTQNEKAERFQIFTQNYNKLSISSRKQRGSNLIGSHHLPTHAVFGLTVMSDLSPAEFNRYKGLNHTLVHRYNFGLALAHPQDGIVSIIGADPLPASFDWRTHDGIVSAVKNQGQCGSCWSFSVVQSVESAWALGGNGLQTLAPQQSIDCDAAESGCDGGWPATNIDYLAKTGLMTEANYPYQAAKGDCKFDAQKVAAKVQDKKYATRSLDEDEIARNLIAYGPVSIAADASQWSQYTTGIMTKDSCSSAAADMDHAITLVGWNTDSDSNIKYWIVRNSWGEQWGEQGYLYLKYGENTCGIANEAVVVTIAAENHNKNNDDHKDDENHNNNNDDDDEAWWEQILAMVQKAQSSS